MKSAAIKVVINVGTFCWQSQLVPHIQDDKKSYPHKQTVYYQKPDHRLLSDSFWICFSCSSAIQLPVRSRDEHRD